ncbi:hypothetical protein KFE25_008415 [Diacronema lutheri]|uniref:Hemerythrin-like domain-containing protein n=2 Tax=Diacronema lutheri TaxID=2081491 RepID=A0A8J6C8M8_DIALT|nr:hypothetical protein KFE25_008415 [Diacronema lutheri]
MAAVGQEPGNVPKDESFHSVPTPEPSARPSRAQSRADVMSPEDFDSVPTTPFASPQPSRAHSRQDVLTQPSVASLSDVGSEHESFASAPPTPGSLSEVNIFSKKEARAHASGAATARRRAPQLLGAVLLAFPLSAALGACYLVGMHLRLRARVVVLERTPTALRPSAELPWFAAFVGVASHDGAKRVVTSSAFPDPVDWHEERHVLPHEPFRRSVVEVDFHLTRLADARLAEARAGGDVPTCEPGAGPEARRVKTLNFFSWFESRFRPALIAHNRAEDEHVYPRVRQRQPVPDSIEAEHAQLCALLDQMQALAPPEDAGQAQTDAALAAVSELWAAFRAVLFTHFTDEELLALPISETFSRNELRAQGKAEQLRAHHADLSARRLLLPAQTEAMLEWAGKERYEAWAEAELPLLERLLHDYVWLPSHVVWHDGFLQSLRSDLPDRIDEQTDRCCGAASPSAATAPRQ